MIDIHSHILHGLDDGPQSLDESVELIRCLISQGVTSVIATPHLNKGYLNTKKADISRNYSNLIERLSELNISFEINIGHEINVKNNIYEILRTDRFYTLAGSKYVLLELNDSMIDESISEIMYEVHTMGYIPVIAHVERYSTLYNDTEILESLLDENVLLQINASSLFNSKHIEMSRFCSFLLSRGLVSFVASDTHNTSSRPPMLADAYNVICNGYGKSYADEIFTVNASKLLLDESIAYKYMAEEPKRRSFFGLFG